ncbi:MAG: type II secretion system F family protein [Acidimicrobiia bacterium]
MARLRNLAVLAAVAAGAVVLGSACTPALAQEAQPLEFVSVDKRAYPEVGVTVATTGDLATAELDSESFELRQDGERRDVTVKPVASSDIEVALVIDTSGSIEGAPLEAAKAAAIGFLEQMRLGTRVVVVGFGDTAYVAAPMTTDAVTAIAAVQSLQATGETALYDGVATALDQFSADAQRSLVVLSDGKDTVSVNPLAAVNARMAASGVAFYGVNLETPDSDPASIEQLADSASGRVIDAADPAALAGVYDAVAAQFASQYLLTFRSEGTGGSSEIRVSTRDGERTGELERVVDLPTAPPEAPADAAGTPQVVTAPGNDWALPVGLVCLFVALLVAGLILFAPRARQRRRDRGAAFREEQGRRRGQLTELTDRATSFAERTLEGGGRRRKLTDGLEHAGIALRPGEFLVLAVTSSFVTFAGAFLLAGPIVGLVLAGLVAFGFWFSLSFLAKRRRTRFGDQLPDTLQLLSGSLRAGYGILQAIDAVARESEKPTGEEFGRVVIETRLGRNPSEALHALASRMANDDFEWVVQAMDIHREVGGDLTEVLDTVAGTIRQRSQLRRQVKALSAEGRLSAWILFLLPIVMFAAFKVINPDYMNELTSSTVGWIMMAGAALLMALGGLWLKKLVKLEF